MFELLKTRRIDGEAGHLPCETRAKAAELAQGARSDLTELPLFLRQASQSLASAKVLRGSSERGANLLGQGRDL